MVLLMQKPWPLADARPSSSHTSLQWYMNQVHLIGDQDLSAISKAKSRASGGMSILAAMWCSNAQVALQSHVESEILIWLPSAFILVHGTSKWMYFNPLEAVPHVIIVEHEK